jgi:aminopeptidase N
MSSTTRYLLILVGLLLTTGCRGSGTEGRPGAPGLDDPYFPGLGNDGYDVQHYDLELEIDVEQETLHGGVTITAVAEQDLSRFNLDFSDYDIDRLMVNGRQANYQQEDLELTVIPRRPHAAGDQFTVSVAYEGIPPTHARQNPSAGGARVGMFFYPDGAFTIGEPTGPSYWFPANDHPSDKATYTIRVTVAEPWEVAANGLLVDTIDRGDERTYVFQPRDPMASYLVTIGVGDFDVTEEVGPGGVLVRNYFQRDIPQSRRDEFKDQTEMMRYFETVFGPYPFEAYGSVVYNIPGDFALETQTLSIFTRQFTVPAGFTVEVVAHELAHQWYGDSVSLASWEDIWLNEGFATYAEVLWLEHSQGQEAADNLVLEYYSRMAQSDTVDSPPGDPGPEGLFALQVYERSALTLHALRLRVGDEVFFDILRMYSERFRNGNATTADFIALAEELGGGDLRDLFDDWLYEQALPDIPEVGLYRDEFSDFTRPE